MKIPVMIWRESVYKNGFKCSCGERLMKDGIMKENLLFDPVENLVICPKCKKVVAMIKGEHEVPDGKTKMMGRWTEA